MKDWKEINVAIYVAAGAELTFSDNDHTAFDMYRITDRQSDIVDAIARVEYGKESDDLDFEQFSDINMSLYDFLDSAKKNYTECPN